MRMLPGSAFMPTELVEWSFEQLVVTFPENAYNLGGNYIKKQTLNGQMNAPLYQISLWNNYHQVPQGLLRTTNFVEIDNLSSKTISPRVLKKSLGLVYSHSLRFK